MADNKLAELYVEIKAKTDKLDKELQNIKNRGKKTSDSMSSSFSGLKGTFLKVAGSVTAITVVMNKLIQSAQKQAIAQAQVEQAVKRTGEAAGFTSKQLFRMASDLQELTGIGDEDILTGITNQLLTFSNVSGDVFKRAQAAVLDLNAVIAGGEVGALTSQTIQLGKALNDPIQGINALTRVGIAFTQQQKDQIKELVKQNDLFSAQSIILTEIEKQYGGQAEALNKATGGLKSFGASLGDLLEKIGGPLLQVVGYFATQLNKLITPTKTFKENQQDVNEEAYKTISRFDSLSQKYLDLKKKVNLTAIETKLYKGYIDELNKIAPNYLKNVNLEKDGYDDVAKALKEARTQLDLYYQSKIRTAALEDDTSKLASIYTEIKNNENEVEQLQSLIDEAYRTLSRDLADVATMGWKDAIERTKKDNKELEKEYNNLEDIIIKKTTDLNDWLENHKIGSPFNDDTTGGDGGDKQLNDIIKKYQELQNSVREYQKLWENTKDPILKGLYGQELARVKNELRELEESAKRFNETEIDIDIKLGKTPEELKEEFEKIVKPVEIPVKPVIDENSFTIAEERIMDFMNYAVQSQITAADAMFAGVDALAQGMNAAFDTMWDGIKLSEEEAKNALIVGFVTIANEFIRQVQRMIAQWLAFQAIMAIGDALIPGFGSTFRALFGHHGGTFENGQKVKGYAQGGSFIVPNGFERDSFPLLVESGERVTVTPRNAVGNELQVFNLLGRKLDAVNKNLAIVQGTLKSQNLQVTIDGKNLIKSTLKPAENKMRDAGYDINKF